MNPLTSRRGIQRTAPRNLTDVDFMKTTIQGAIELGLQHLKPINDYNLILSSRTDAGVHALHSTVHVDLHRRNGLQYHETAITLVLNRFLFNQRLPIRVLRTEHVPDTFHSRYSAKSRTYVYRLATPKRSATPIELQTVMQCHTKFMPIEEIDRCFFTQYVHT